MYKVSIVLPTYNGEDFLSSAIDSIRNQTYRDWELIIVNDASTDKTASIAKQYADVDARIKLINNVHNLKLPQSLNIGFENSIGELLTWTSDDNLMKPTMLEHLVNCFLENATIDFVYADSVPIDEVGRIMTKLSYLNAEIDDIYVKNPIGACFMYTRNVYNEIGNYNTELFTAEDYDYWLRIYEYGFKMFHLKQKLYYYRFHKNSLTNTKVSEHGALAINMRKQNLKKVKDEAQRNKILSEIEGIQKQIDADEGKKNWQTIIHDVSMKWLTIKIEGKSIENYFISHNYKNVVVYGCKQFAELMFSELKDTNITILYGVDRDLLGTYTESFSVMNPNDLSITEMNDVDVVVVTAISHFADITNSMKLSIYGDCPPIVSLEEVIDEIYYAN